MSRSNRRTFTEDFRRFFLRGLVVLLPSVLTLWIVVYAYQFVDDAIAQPINAGARFAVVEASRVWEPIAEWLGPTEEELATEMAAIEANGRAPNPEETRMRLRRAAMVEWWDAHWYMNFIGLLIAIIAVYISGRLLGGFLGRRVYRRLENLITTLPVFKQVYPYVKQIVDFLFSDDQPIKFNRVVTCQYPRKGIWSVGFMTGDSMRDIRKHAGQSVSVFVPSSPTPFTGYTITVPIEDVIELPISVEEAIRFAVSGGVLVPGDQAVPGSERSGLIPIDPPTTAPSDSESETDECDTMPPR